MPYRKHRKVVFVEWDAVIQFFLVVLTAVALVGSIAYAIWRSSQPVCYGIEPDNEVETLQPCPAPHKAGDRFQISEDQFEGLEVDD